MRAHEAVSRTGLSGSNSGTEFSLFGGLYQVNFVGTWNGGSIQLSQLGADAATWLSVTGQYTANGGDTVYLPPGRYRWVVVTATSLSAMIARVPGE